MQCALLVDHDSASRERTASLLRARGYLVAGTGSADIALHTAQTIRVDVVLTDTAFNAHDRRSFIGELRRLAPPAPIILLTDGPAAAPIHHDGCSAVLSKPVTAGALRRVLEFGIDGYGMLPSHTQWEHERRRSPDRRHRAR